MSDSKTADRFWLPIETAPRGRDADGVLQPILLVGRYPSNGYPTDVVQGWWVDPVSRDEQGSWERWRHAFPPLFWAPVPELPR